MAIGITEVRAGMTIEMAGIPYLTLEYHHQKMAQRANVRLKLKNLKTGAIIERTFNVDEKIERAHIERKEMQYIYPTPPVYTFMDQETFEQITLSESLLGEAPKYMVPGSTITIMFYKNEAIGVDLPAAVKLKVIETGPSFKGDTVTGGAKPAKLESGLTLQVPLFIEVGDIIKVDTRTGKYIERV